MQLAEKIRSCLSEGMLLLRRSARLLVFLLWVLACIPLISVLRGEERIEVPKAALFQGGMEERLVEVQRLILMGDSEEALAIVDEGMEILRRDELWSFENSLLELGFAASRQGGDSDSALSWVRKYVDPAEEHPPRRLRFSGEAAFQLKEFEQAESFLLEALRRAAASGQVLEEARAAFTLAQVSLAKGDIPNALEASTRALDLYRDLARFADVARCYLLRGEIQLASEEWSLARMNAMAADDLARQYQLGSLQAQAARILAESAYQRNDLSTALIAQVRYDRLRMEALEKDHALVVETLRADRNERLDKANRELNQIRGELNEALQSRVEARTEARSFRIGMGLSLMLVLLLSLILIFQLTRWKQRNKQAQVELEKKLHETEVELCDLRARIEEVNTANSRFLSNISHEIRTPMNAVIGMATLLADTPLNEEQRECVSTISSSSHALLGILNDILDYARIESGSFRLQHVPFYLSSVLDEVLDIFSARARGKGIHLVSKVSEFAPRRVVGDPVRLRQILHNVVGNALKYTEAGEVSIHVTRVTATLEGVVLGFSVRDTGIGIPSDQKKLIFEPFIQAHADLDRHLGGAGLGLAVCQRLVSLMDGDIWVESEPGRGSTFHFTLHLGVDRRKIEERLESAHCLGKTALIIDSDETVRRVLSIQAGQVGVSCLQAESIAVAQQVLAGEEPVHVILLDLEQKGMASAEMVQQLHQVPGHQDTPIIGLLTDPADASRKVYGQLRLSDYLSKTPRREVLFDALAKALSIHPVDEPHPPLPVPKDAPKLRILVAEDNTINQRVAYLLLRNLGYEATLASDGREVLDLVEKQTFDLILMDIHMPLMDGVEATRQIRQTKAAGQQPRIFAMTAAITDEDRSNCQAAGMDGFLSKPVEIADMAKVVQETKPLKVS